MADLPSIDIGIAPAARGEFGTGLHHLGYLTSDLEGTAGHFVAALDYRIESGVIEDRAQTARVQFLRQPGEPSWLELVTPSGSKSKLSNALRRGEGFHHVCYEVTDFELACRAYRERGCFMVGKPTPAAAFGERRIAWFMDRRRFLFELVEEGPPPLSLASLRAKSS